MSEKKAFENYETLTADQVQAIVRRRNRGRPWGRKHKANLKMARIKNNPKVGDQIIQECGIRLRVTAVDGDSVSWERITKTGRLIEPNTWSLVGWRDMVCKNARAA